MNQRQQKILEAIVKFFIETGSPVGSKMLTSNKGFKVSPATIRNEMAALEREGYIMQPHTSAGRVPTSQAYRMVVNEMQMSDNLMMKARNDLQRVREEYFLSKAKEKLHDMVSILASTTNNISFATLPDRERVFYIGISNILKQPEFFSNPKKATQVVEILENELYDVLSDLEITHEGGIFIGEENILPEFSSCSLLAYPYEYNGLKGLMGILGSTRMDYAYNMAALRSAVQLL